MRKYKFAKALVEPWDTEDPPDGEVVLTEHEIMYGMGYWHFYRMKMKEAGKEDEIDYERALEVFVVCSWGTEVK